MVIGNIYNVSAVIPLELGYRETNSNEAWGGIQSILADEKLKTEDNCINWLPKVDLSHLSKKTKRVS